MSEWGHLSNIAGYHSEVGAPRDVSPFQNLTAGNILAERTFNLTYLNLLSMGLTWSSFPGM